LKNLSDFFAALDHGLALISRACILFCSIAIVVLLVIFGWLVFGRYVLNNTPTWVEQMSLLIVVYITFIGAAAGIREETHLGVDFIREGMPDAIRKPLRILVDVIMAGFGLIMCMACVELVQFGWDTKLAMLGIPEGVRTLSAAICGGLIFLFSLGHVITKTRSYYFPDAQSSQESN
jgi:TRAP-type C4-dicarboxylate transport system permease small subunit